MAPRGAFGVPRGFPPGFPLSIRAQLLLVLTVFAAIPFLAYAYIRELESVLRDAQERALAGTAQAVATALHDRPRLFSAPVPRLNGQLPRDLVDAAAASALAPADNSPAELQQILGGLTRTSARIEVVDRDLKVLASAGTLDRPPDTGTPPTAIERLLHPLYAAILRQPVTDVPDDAGSPLAPRREITAALNGIGATERRTIGDGAVTVVSAAYPIWVGDNVRGAVIAEETTNTVLAARNRAFERLFTWVLAVLLVGSLAVTLYATWLASRIRRLRDDVESAIDAQGRVRHALAGSSAGDEIGDLSRGLAAVLARLADYASYQEQMAGRLSHELRTPIAVVRSSLDNLRQTYAAAAAGSAAGANDATVYVERAQAGLDRLSHILTRMSEAARLEHALADTERVRYDAAAVIAACVEGYRSAYPDRTLECHGTASSLYVAGAPELLAQMLDKLVANAMEFATADPVVVRVAADADDVVITVDNTGPPLPAAMQGRLFDSMVSVRSSATDGAPHLGLGLYVVRLIVAFHGGSVEARTRAAGDGVVVTVTLPRA
ncbi:MAG: hypothetical protein JSR18_07370 [Proteobacteria bacterium]|nr:hypothetical protein [Pseudomonadota bacterium]